jgi:6-phosphogluconolactonase/glucosamine-6-phosphate isomerase/deaminase
MAVEDAKPDSAADPYTAKLRATAGSLPVLDLIHTGLGAHEHTASLVPGDPVLNFSWNCGVEGPSDDPEVERLRTRQVKNFIALTLLPVGTPMLLAGDEVRSSQRGNNAAHPLLAGGNQR